MSAATILRTENIHVRLLNEEVEVWRPVRALRVAANLYVVAAQSIPDDEEWEFPPGTAVETEERALSSRGEPVLSRVAIGAAAVSPA